MKHLFLVHSHITFVVSKQYVFDQGLEPKDCIFICSRNYILPIEYDSIFIQVINYPEDIFLSKEFDFLPKMNLLKGYHNIHILEKHLRSFTQGDAFFLYAMNTGTHLVCAIVTMPECYGYYLIEEGTSSYTERSELAKLYHKRAHEIVLQMLRFISKRLFIVKDHIFSYSTNYYLGTIATSQKAFPNYPKQKIIVSNPFEIIQLSQKPDVVLSVDASFILYNVPRDTVENVLIRIRNIINKENKSNVAYKFHPLYYKDLNTLTLFRDIINQIFGQSSFELPPTTVIENVLKTYNSDFYSDVSSVGIYATNFGIHCYSYAKIMVEMLPNSEYSDHIKIDNLPQIIKESYTFIE